MDFLERFMKTSAFVVAMPRQRRRAVELYGRDTPFRARTERNRMAYNRKPKHRGRDLVDQ
ncbi:MAG: hypothetical protein ACO2ZI_07390 [Paracoccaceae bacterium]|jgi:stalled ribosome alternative rescue factor ArfA